VVLVSKWALGLEVIPRLGVGVFTAASPGAELQGQSPLRGLKSSLQGLVLSGCSRPGEIERPTLYGGTTGSKPCTMAQTGTKVPYKALVLCAILLLLSVGVGWRFCRRRAMPALPAGSMYHQSFLTPQEVSDLLRVSVYTVRRWIREGSLPAYKVGRGWRIREDDLSRWLDRQRVVKKGRD
jgi:excisionase family DNA binding protein